MALLKFAKVNVSANLVCEKQVQRYKLDYGILS